MRVILLLVSLITLLNSQYSYAQKISKRDLIGKWHLVKITQDTAVILDVNNIELLKQKNSAKLRESKPDYTALDSISEIEHIISGIEEIKKLFIQFNIDNTYVTSKVLRGGDVSKSLEKGHYKFQNRKNMLTMIYKGSKTESKISLKNNLLTIYSDFDLERAMIFMK